ncbi:MAG: DUF87 domain-containing protein [Candidatus Microsaccharimonas sp.]
MAQKTNTHLGFPYWSELFLTRDQLTDDDWKKILRSIGNSIGFLREWILFVHIENGSIRYYVGSDRDVSGLSNNLDGLSLQIVDPSIVNPPLKTSHESFLQFVTGGSLLDLKERYEVKKSRTLEWVAFSLRSLGTEKVICSSQFVFNLPDGTYSAAKKRFFELPSHLLAVDFATNTKFTRTKQPKYLNIQKGLHLLRSDNLGALFEVETFPYLPKNYFLPLEAYDFDKHSFIVGASGSGKSKFIGLFVSRLLQNATYRQKYRVVVIDPHAALEDDLGVIEQSNVISFKNPDDGTELFAGSGTDIHASAELTGTLFKSLLGDQFNAKLERVMRFSIYVLMTAQVMTLDNLKRLLTDVEYRQQLLEHVGSFIPENITRFFNTDFNELRTQSYNEAISPIVTLVEELQLQPSLSNQSDDSISLGRLIASKPLTVFSLNKVSMGEKVVKTVAGLLIQQIFLLAQARSFSEKIILVIDEVSVVQNPTIAQILAEARKYNLSVFLTQQYFGQIEKPIQDAIFANVSNYYTFRVSEEDARALEGNITMELPKDAVDEERELGNKETDAKVRIMTSLNTQEVIARLSADGQLMPAMKAKTMHFEGTRMNKNVELQQYTEQNLPTKFQESIKAQSKVFNQVTAAPNTKLVKFDMAALESFAESNKGQSLTPEFEHITPKPNQLDAITLEDFLAAQSSSPDKQERKK